MAYVMSCRDMGFDDCDYEAWAETKDELMELAAAHAKQAHGVGKTPELSEKLREAIKEV